MSCCPQVVVNVPGIAGTSPFTFTTANFTIPPVGSNVTVSVVSTVQFVAGQSLLISYPAGILEGHFQVQQIISPTSVSLTFLGVNGDRSSGSSVPSGAQVNPDGVPGQSAFTTISGIGVSLTFGFNANVNVVNASWIAVGQVVLLSDGTNFANLRVVTVTAFSFVGTPLNYQGDTLGGYTYAIGSKVVCSGVATGIGVLPSAIVDNSGQTPAGAIPVGAGESIIEFDIPVMTNATGYGTTGGTFVAAYVPGFAFQIMQFDFISTTAAGTGGGASQVFQPQINGSNITGGSCTVTLTSVQTLGKVTAGAAISSPATGTNSQSIGIVFNTGGTVFTAGSGRFLMRIKNLDTANALSSLAAAVNGLIAAL